MSQTKQLQKAKLYRGLKIAFYTLGLPLFFFAVICTAIKFIGEDPFVGMASSSLSSGVFESYERFMTSPALYGIWCALAVWVFIVICHAIVSKTMKKNFHLRLFTMIAIVLVVMLGTMGIMDAAFTSKIDKIAESAPDGVTVQDYKTQLSYYGYVSSGRKNKSLANDLMNKVSRLETAYNIEYQGINKSGDAGNMGNKPVTYDRLIAADGTRYSGSKSGLVTEKPNKSGVLVVDGVEYANYYYLSRKGDKTEVTVWYDLDRVPVGYKWNAKKGKMEFNTTNGVYGEALYNESGLLSDGWIFSFENMLEILEDLYEGQAYIDKLTSETDVAMLNEIRSGAAQLMKDYYAGTAEIDSQKAPARLQEIAKSEEKLAEDFTITEGELNELYSAIGELLGDNALFDWLFLDERVAPLLGSLPVDGLGTLVDDLKTGVSLKGLLTGFGAGDLMGQILGVVQIAFKDSAIEDLVIKVSYAEDQKLLLAVYKNEVNEDNMLLDINCEAGQFNLDNLNTFLNTLLDNLVDGLGLDSLLQTVGGLFQDMGNGMKGIVVSGISIPLMDAEGNISIDVRQILMGLLETLYTYQSPVLKPVWEFYEAYATANMGDNAIKAARYLAMYERANYEATVHGNMIGSILYGDAIGSGAYNAGAGLTDLASVRQLKMDLSYQPGNFPLYSFRDMLLISSGIVVCFYILYMIMAEKEKQYALKAQSASEGDDAADEAEGEKKPNKFVASMKAAADKVSRGVDNICEKASAGATKAADSFKKRTNWDDKKTAKVSKILTIVLYVVAFLPVVLIPLVLGAMSCNLLPSYSIWHFIGFIVALVFAAIFALVIILVSRKKSKTGAKGAFARGWRIGLTYICLTVVFALLLTYLLPDLVAKGTSNTIYAEDLYYNSIQQVEKNTQLEHQYIIYNLLNGNMNRYETKDGKTTLAEDGDFSYEGLTAASADGRILNDELRNKMYDYLDENNTMNKVRAMLKDVDPTRKELYEFIYQNYVLTDPEYAFNVQNDERLSERHCLALAIADYLCDHADYRTLIKKGFKNPKLKQLFTDNYDSFNQDGYKTFDDPLLLYAQMNGRMTVPIIIRLILNKGWSYSRPNADGNYELEDNFLYEIYDPDAYAEYVAAGGTFTETGELVNGDGSTYQAKYGYNEQGWMIFENGIVRRPVNWLVLDMLGDPMDLASIDLSKIEIIGFPIQTVFGMLWDSGYKGAYKGIGGLLTEDLGELVEKVANGASLRIGAYVDDNLQLKLQLLPMNSYYGMLGYMQASWVQSNNLIMAIVNLESMRNGLLIMGGIGLVPILLATLLSEEGRKAQARLEAATASNAAEQGEENAEPEAEPAAEQPAEESAPAQE